MVADFAGDDHIRGGQFQTKRQRAGGADYDDRPSDWAIRRSDDLRETAKTIPLDRLLVETDAPYLTPEPHRKIRRNEPRFVVETARRLAEVRGEDFADLARATTANFRRLVSLQGPS